MMPYYLTDAERKEACEPLPLEALPIFPDAVAAMLACARASGAPKSRLVAYNSSLIKSDWSAAKRQSEALVAEFPDLAPSMLYAAAVAGAPGAAEPMAAAWSEVAVRRAHWLRAHAWKAIGDKEAPDDATLVAKVQERLRNAASEAIGWGAVARGLLVAGVVGATPPQFQACSLGQDVDAALWQGLQDSAWRSAYAQAKKESADQLAVPEYPAPAEDRPEDIVDLISEPSSIRRPETYEDGVLVLASVGSSESSGGKAVFAAVKEIVGKRLPILRADEETARQARARLVSEFPQAVGVIDTLLRDAHPNRGVHLRPTVLVGESGAGKSRLARRVLECLGVPTLVLDAGTMDDKAITGTSRRWHSAHPSLPVSHIERHRIANPGIVLDELEKAGRSSAGSVHDSLLSLLEQSTARVWRDHYVDAPCDLSWVSWIFTANGLDGIPPPLRNRVRILRVPRPGREHVPALAAAVLRELLDERGVDHRWEPPLDGEELSAIEQAFGAEGSVRDLKRYVEAALDARAAVALRN